MKDKRTRTLTAGNVRSSEFSACCKTLKMSGFLSFSAHFTKVLQHFTTQNTLKMNSFSKFSKRLKFNKNLVLRRNGRNPKKYNILQQW